MANGDRRYGVVFWHTALIVFTPVRSRFKDESTPLPEARVPLETLELLTSLLQDGVQRARY